MLSFLIFFIFYFLFGTRKPGKVELEDVLKDGEYFWEGNSTSHRCLLALSGLMSGFFNVGGVNGKVQKTLMERDHTSFGRVDSGHER